MNKAYLYKTWSAPLKQISVVGALLAMVFSLKAQTVTISTGCSSFLSGANLITPTSMAIELNGGALNTYKSGTTTTGYNQTFGTLNLSASSTINLGTGNAHTLTFAASNAVSWTASTTLTINNWVGSPDASGTLGKIFIGNSAAGLTTSQLSQITFVISGVSYLAKILSTGEIVPTLKQFKTVQNGNWNLTSTWNQSVDGGTTWVAATSTPTNSDGSVSVLHNVNVTASVTVDQVTISSAATLTVNSTYTLTVNNGTGDDITLDGTLVVNGTVSNSGAIQINTSGYYNHANGTALPTGISWGSSGSAGTLEVSGSATCSNLLSVSGTSELFDVIWTSSGALPGGYSSGNFQACNGDMTLNNASASWQLYSSGSGSNGKITVGGNFNLLAGTVNMNNGNGSISGGSYSGLNVVGDYTQSGGTVNILNTGSGSYTGALYVQGDFTHTSGTFSSTGTGKVYLNGTTGIQNIESIGQSGNVDFDVATSNAQCRVVAGKTFVYSLGTQFNIGAGTANPDLLIDGTFNRLSSAAITGSSVTISVSSGGLYISNYNTATIPTATWDANATLQIDASIADDEFTESFGHVIFNNSAGCTMYTGLSAFTQTIQGNLTLNSTGNIYLHNVSTQSSTLTINGNLVMSANGLFDLDNNTMGSSLTKKVVVLGNYTQTAGTLRLSSNTSTAVTAGGRYVMLDVYGNFSHTAGTLSETATDIDLISRINLLGTTATNFASTGQTGNVEIVCNKTGTTGNDIVTLTANSQIDYNITLTDGLVNLSTYNLTLGAAATATGTPSANNMIVPTSTGELRKVYSATGSFTFPVGDNTGTREYSPLTLNFTGGTFSSAYAGVKLDNIKHPSNPSATDFINRYWTVSTSGITSPVCTATLIYADGDIAGTEANLFGGRYLSAAWNCLDAVTASTNTISKAGITAFGAFSAGDGSSMNCIVCTNPTSGGTIATAQTICSGADPAAFTSVSLPSGSTGTLEYKWQSSTTSSSAGFTDINLATSATYDAPTGLTQTTWYKRLSKVTCSATWAAAGESNVIEVTVSPTSVGGTIAGSATVCTGTNSTTLTLSGHTGSITKWQSSPDGTTWSDIVNTATTYTVTNISATTYYRAVVTSGVCSSANSSSATMTVSPASVGGSISGGTTVCTGTNSTTLTLSGNTGSVTKWQSSTDGTSWSDIANTAATYTVTNISATTYYRAVVTSGACASANSSSATMTVSPASVGGSIAGGTTVCTGTNSTVLTLSGHTGSITKWQSSTDGTSWSDIANTTTTYTVTNISSTTYYRAVVNSGSCSTANSSSATMTVNNRPTSAVLSGTTSICNGSSANLTVAITGGTSPYTVVYTGNGGGTVSSYTSGSNIAQSPTTTTTYGLTSVTDANGCTATTPSGAPMITVNPLPTVTASANPTTACLGQTVTLTGVSGMSSYSWSGPSGATISDATLQSPTVTMGATSGVFTLTVTNSNGCTASANTSSVTAATPNVAGLSAGDVLWSGSNSSDWNTNTNWLVYNGASSYSIANTSPQNTTSVKIPATGTCVVNMPEVIGSRDANNVTILAGAQLTVTGTLTVAGSVSINASGILGGNGTINVSDGWVNNGTFNAGSGTVVFNGTSSSVLVSGNNTFNNLSINGGAGLKVSLQNNTTVNSTLTLGTGSTGKLDVGGNTLTVGTSSSIGSITGGSATSYIVAYDNGSGTIGKIKRFVNSTASTAYSFPIGDASNYTPLTYTNVSGTAASGAYLEVYTKATKIPQMHSSITNYVNRYWEVAPSGITSPNYNITYTYVTGDVIGSQASFVPVKYSSGTWYRPNNSVFTNGTAQGTASGPTSNAVTWSGLTTFSQFGVAGSVSAPLPTELTSFQANCSDNNTVDVTWSTASEHNTNYFRVDKSRNGTQWDVLGTIGAAGNSTYTIDYALTDQFPNPGINYYRLTQYDNDGVFETFDVQAAVCKDQQAGTALSTYPNPSSSDFNVDLQTDELEGEGILIVSDAKGAVIHSQDIKIIKGTNNYIIQHFQAEPGIYYISVKAGASTVTTKHSLR